MYKLNEWASKIEDYKSRNAYSRLQWLIKGKDNEYVTVDFIKSAKKTLEQEHRNTIAFLNSEIEKRKQSNS